MEAPVDDDAGSRPSHTIVRDSIMAIRLYPTPTASVPVGGLYLDSGFRRGLPPDRLLVYANFVSSLDGRIAVADTDTGIRQIPAGIANPTDWRLFQELAAHADVLLTSGRYMRDLAAGLAQDTPPVSPKPAFEDIIEYRLRHGMNQQPDLAVVSRRLDFEIPAALLLEGRRILVLTGEPCDPLKVERLQGQGANVIYLTARGNPRGAEIAEALATRGYRSAYTVTGPEVLHTLVRDGTLERLYLTTIHRLTGGATYSSILEGPALSVPEDFRLTSLVYDPGEAEDVGQCFARFDRVAG